MLFLLLFVFWILLNGHITVEIVLIGGCVCGLLAVFSYKHLRFTGNGIPGFCRSFPALLSYFIYLIGQIFLSNLQVMKKILIFRDSCAGPKLVWFSSGLHEEGTQLALANSISLTPGTVTVSLGKDTICVCALSPEFAEELKDSAFIDRLKTLEGIQDG
ncbi:MAG: Na+/H+ antiporter subunit E [Lawsonibacter sp.]|nr:Na+/H+ antiporter subunit E [Lawsonibacter sp.]